MSFFNKIFGGSEDGKQEKASFWKSIESESDLEQILADSQEKTVVIFKHSTRCIISRTVLRNFEKDILQAEKNADFYLLDLLAHRNLSNKIAQDLEVHHESPQLILISKGKVQKFASHHSISASML